MPIYEYECPKCGEFEQRQSLSDPVLKRCPTCKAKVTKLISSSAFSLKGGGWYSDAYQKKATPAAAPSESSSSTASTASTSGTSTGGSSGSSD
ncbi:MAG: FmdB family zinc ribbon protein [Candidatus Binatia bacterium]